MKIDQNRLARVQDERFFFCIQEGNLYEIRDIKIIDSEIWIQATDSRVYKDSDVLTVSESGDYYALRSWMKQKLNIDY